MSDALDSPEDFPDQIQGELTPEELLRLHLEWEREQARNLYETLTIRNRPAMPRPGC